MELTAEQLDTITCNAEDHGGTVTDYSGRGMYGRHCFAITVDGPPTVFALRFGSALGDADADLARELSEQPVNTDSLGLGYVIYWPNVTVPAFEVGESPMSYLGRDDGRRGSDLPIPPRF